MTIGDRRDLAEQVLETQMPYRWRQSLAFCIWGLADTATAEQRARYTDDGAGCVELYDAYREQIGTRRE